MVKILMSFNFFFLIEMLSHAKTGGLLLMSFNFFFFIEMLSHAKTGGLFES